MPLPDGPFIFVSYSSKDSDFVHAEIERLTRQGYAVWYDKGEIQPGLLWDEQIRRAIRACACFIVFITQDAVDSEHVRDEMGQALEAGKPFIPIYWEQVELPPGFEKPLRSIQALERYSMRRPELEYEAPLSKALSEYVKKIEPPHEVRDEGLKTEAAPPADDRPPDTLPKIVFFALALFAGGLLFLAFVVALTPYFTSPTPGDPLGSRLAGFMTSLFLTCVAVILSAGAFAVHRVYLRRKDV